MFTEQPTLQSRQLYRTFEDGGRMNTVLAGASLDVRRGELVVLMGPSGSGKSTLLAMLSGLLQPSSGQVFVHGQDLWQMSERSREQLRQQQFGFIFQGYNLFPALTARQQLEIALRWGEGASSRDARQRADCMLGRLGLANKKHLRPAQLSGGEKQRVAVGRALVKTPTLCFADEPTSALDWAHGEEVISLLQSAAHQEGATVLVVSHDERVQPFADRVFHLDRGALTEPVARPERALAPSHQGV
jgi:putative ABC transport system ATP-binding protein